MNYNILMKAAKNIQVLQPIFFNSIYLSTYLDRVFFEAFAIGRIRAVDLGVICLSPKLFHDFQILISKDLDSVII